MIPQNNLVLSRLLTISVLFALCLADLIAGDYWNRKPFTQWDEQEARRLLAKSPWGKSLLFANGDGGRSGDVAGRSRIDPLRNQQMDAARGSRPRRTTGTPSGVGSSDGRVSSGEAKVYETALEKAGRSESYHVFWYSSLRSRQAIARLRQLHGLIVDEQMKALALQTQNHYVLALSGSGARFFRYADLADLQSKTFILSKRDKHKRIELAAYASPQALDYPIALFFCPRESNGRQLLDLEDEEVRFITEQGPLRVKVSFKLRQMITDGKLDL